MDDHHQELAIKTIDGLIKRLQFEQASSVLDIARYTEIDSEQLVKLEQKLNRFMGNGNTRGPDFMVVGTQKGGTSSLNGYLSKHPQVCTASLKKELHFFDGSSAPLENYHKCFLPKKEHRVVGETTPSYMFYPGAMEHIAVYNPNMKIIIILRDPMERLYSHWQMMKRKKKKSIHPVWARDIVLGDVCNFEDMFLIFQSGNSLNRFNPLKRSLYSPQLDNIYRLFAKDRVLIILSEALKENRKYVLSRGYDFLVVDEFDSNEEIERRVGNYDTELSRENYLQFRVFFENDVGVLNQKYGVDTSGWMRKY